MKKKHILVTGAAGFIGFHVAKQLHIRNDFVIGYDNYSVYYDPRLKYARTNELKHLGIETIEADICDLKKLSEIVEKYQITHILHLAAQAGVRYSLEKPFDYLETNLNGFLTILELCRKYSHLKLTYASSSSIYGLNEKTPFSLEDRSDNQASLYGVTKKSNELMANTYHHLFKIPVTGLRFFTVYGPWGRPDMAYFSFTKAILEDQPISIYNDGKMKRDFTYIDEIVNGTIAAIDLEAECEIFNLGNNQPVELLHFIEIIEKALGKKAKKQFLPMQKGDVHITYADISVSSKKLNFNPKTTLEVGIGNFVDWYRSYHNIKS